MSGIPRDVSGRELMRGLERLGYERIRQSGSHVRLRHVGDSTHRITVPDHNPLPVGTLGGILGDVASHLGITRDQLLDLLSL